jgi:uncharacterized DUF497 family protein
MLQHEEAATVFNDSLSVTFPDPDHSIGESRYVIIGISRFGQLLLSSSVYLCRLNSKPLARLISVEEMRF